MVPGASPGPPRGLPEASLGPPGAILEDMQRNAKKQEKQKGSPDPIFQKNVKFTDPGWTPKSSRSRRVKLGPEASRERPEPLQKKRSFLNVFRDPQKTEK